MSSESTNFGLNLAAIGVIAAIITIAVNALGRPWFVVVFFLIWLLLWFLAALLMSEPEKRGFLAATLKHSTYTQI